MSATALVSFLFMRRRLAGTKPYASVSTRAGKAPRRAPPHAGSCAQAGSESDAMPAPALEPDAREELAHPLGAHVTSAPSRGEMLQAMTVKDLRARLAELGLSHEGMLEKAEYVDAIVAAERFEVD